MHSKKTYYGNVSFHFRQNPYQKSCKVHSLCLLQMQKTNTFHFQSVVCKQSGMFQIRLLHVQHRGICPKNLSLHDRDLVPANRFAMCRECVQRYNCVYIPFVQMLIVTLDRNEVVKHYVYIVMQYGLVAN